MGCGKSTLMKYLAGHESTGKHLLEWANGQTLHCPSYYFSKTGTSKLQMSLQGLYRTLLATLLQYERDMSRVAFPTWQVSDLEYPPTSAVLRDALEKVLTHSGLSCKYCIFIDGLDEYGEADYGLRGELAGDILKLARLSAVKLVVSSRPEPVFKLTFAHCQTLELHELTKNDIAAYVDAEIRRRALPQVLTSMETDQLHSLCDEVIRKAQGVFLWVTIAVASILNGIADYETLSELRSRLQQLDARLTILFKQILTERVHASHRKQLARILLMECRHDFGTRWLSDGFNAFLETYKLAQAISPHVDTSHDCSMLLDTREIKSRVSDLQIRLPGRSCGLYLDGSTTRSTDDSINFRLEPLRLSHSSLYRFLDQDETRALLLEQAGDDFRVEEAIVIGQIAYLVYRMEEPQHVWPIQITYVLFEIVRRIEMIEISTGLMQTKLISIFGNILVRGFQSENPTLADLEAADPDFDVSSETHLGPPYDFIGLPLLQRRGGSLHDSDLLSLTIESGFLCYLKYRISTCRGFPLKTGTPLLFYPLQTTSGFMDWMDDERSREVDQIYYLLPPFDGKSQRSEECHVAPIRLLLKEGADPNELCDEITPWSVILQKLCSEHAHHVPRQPVRPLYGDTWPEESDSLRQFREKLEIAKVMLQHGADPLLCIETPGYSISPQIFTKLLERECCSGNAQKDCICAFASQVQPLLTELVELVEWRRYFRQQMRTDGELLVQGAWLVLLLAYIVQRFLTSSF